MSTIPILDHIKMEWIIHIFQFIISITLPICLYFWINEYFKETISTHTSTDLLLKIKRCWALYSLNKNNKHKKGKTFTPGHHALIESIGTDLEQLKILKDENSCDSMSFYGVDQKGNTLYIKLTRRRHRIADLLLEFVLSDGRIYVLPEYPDTVIAHNMSRGWSTPWLKMEMLEPMNRWRIIYNGLLRRKTSEIMNNYDIKTEHVRLNCIFIAGSLPKEWPNDWSSELHADALAREPWKSPKWIEKIKLIDYMGYDQWGSIIGEMVFEDSSSIQLYLRGLRLRRWGKHESSEFHKIITFFGATLQGIMFYITASCPKNGFTHLQTGYIKDSNDRIHCIQWTDLDVANFFSPNKNPLQQYQIRCKGDGKAYNIMMKHIKETITISYSGHPSNWTTQIISTKLKVNKGTGIGILQLSYPYNGVYQAKIVYPQICYKEQAYLYVHSNNYVIPFNDRKCQDKALVGGKGASLALLSIVDNREFTVPVGFCITVNAFNLQLKSHKNMQCIINDIENICYGKKIGDLRKSCEQAVQSASSMDIVVEVREAILNAIRELELINENNEIREIEENKENRSSKSFRYAIRSSAIGEDSEETSAAGQNATYLGVKGTTNIINSITKCWASLFSYQSVEYRRQHGLPINSTMGVCIQRMVNAETAGVLFTRYPTTGDPSKIIITANYGLGETVVSGSIEPDMITVHRRWDNNLSIKSSVIGKKDKKVLMDNSSVITTSLTSTEIENVCITHDIALKLAKIGLYIESLFGMATDIEWAVNENQIFLLQARPITTLSSWTEFELTHELDLGVPNDQDILTFANVGEVLLGPLCPLTISTVGRLLNVLLAYQITGNPYASYIHTTSTRLVINYFNTLLRQPNKTITLGNKVVDIAICGHVVITPEVHKIAVDRNGVIHRMDSLRRAVEGIRDLWYTKSILNQAHEMHKKITVNVDECTSIHTVYEKINEQFTNLVKIITCHTHTSRVSVFYQMISMIFLTEGNEEFTPSHFADIGILLSSCSNVISCQIPIALRQITRSIKESGKSKEFSEISADEAFEWLNINCPVAAQEIESFMDKHGHRCIKELDIYAEPWHSNPENLINTIQTLVMSEENDVAKELSVEETVASLKTPKKNFTKWILKKLVPFCRKAVTEREITKDLLVSAVYKIKLAYKRLSHLMFVNGYLPDKDLLYFITHLEIGELIKRHNPTLIKKAIRRRKLYYQLQKLKYPEQSFGVPMPLTEAIEKINKDGLTVIHGTSVCGGSILGRACVIMDLLEAKHIRSGDILITHSTDIGWSPYFPLLGGVVTELGGLISHGAVVAREYGLPCLVGASGATDIINTGDTVLLIGDTGTLQLINKV